MLAAVCGAGILLASNAGRWLNAPDTAAPSDAIVVLGGGYFRPVYAGELYRKGLAPQVVISVPRPDPATPQLAALGVRLVPQEEIYAQVLTAMGVPAAHVAKLGGASMSTFDEAMATRKLLGGAKRILVVTSPFHIRRARVIFADALAGSGVEVAVVAPPQETFPDRWWTSQDAARDVLLEYSKLAFYLAGGRFRSAPAP